MEQPEWPDSGAVALAGTLSILAQSKKVQAHLSDKWGAERLESILAMMRTGTLQGTLGDDIHDFFLDEIENEAQTAWNGSLSGPDGADDPYPVDINEYEGVYFVKDLEGDPIGYFLDIKDAKSYVDANWCGDVREDIE